MSSFIPKVADPEVRLESLLTEKRIITEAERLLALPPAEFQKLPARQREHLHHYRKEARLA